MVYSMTRSFSIRISWFALLSLAFGLGACDSGSGSTNAGTGEALASGGTSSSGGASSVAGTTSTGGDASSAAGNEATGGSAHTGAWKVMLLGDSITGTTCYPQLLSKQLMDGGHTNFELIGTVTNNQSCGATPVKTEGHGGYGVTYLPSSSTRTCSKSSGCGSYAELQTWTAENPEIVLMHYGTNDVWDGQPPTSILAAYLSVIAEFRAQNQSVIFFVSKIIGLSPSGCSNCLTGAGALATAVSDSWASANSTATSPIYIIDHYGCGFDPTSTADAADGVHPTPAGAAKMATVSYQALVAKGYF
jgi:lysophospholipase L1-like esterase